LKYSTAPIIIDITANDIRIGHGENCTMWYGYTCCIGFSACRTDAVVGSCTDLGYPYLLWNPCVEFCTGVIVY
jgi:hypothetical protein